MENLSKFLIPDNPSISKDKLKGIKKGAGAVFVKALLPVSNRETSLLIDFKDSTFGVTYFVFSYNSSTN